MRHRCYLAALAGSAVLFAAGIVQADVFVLANEGRIVGDLLNRDEVPRKTYRVRTTFGGEVTLDRTEVVEVVPQSDRQAEYERIRPTFADTVEDQWKLAEWCREHYMSTEREKHLERIIELDPDHLQARRALGYRKTGDRWITQEQLNTERGLVRYKGKWMLPAEVEAAERRRQIELAERQWMVKLNQWRGWLDGSRAQEAAHNIAAIDDPHAVVALHKRLEDEPSEQIRRLYLAGLASIGDARAQTVLVDVSLKDVDEETRLTALDYLEESPNPEVTMLYIAALRSKDNHTINRAAMGLARMKDPTAIQPLIDALVTTHTFKMTQGSPGGISGGLNTGGGATSSLGSGAPGGGISFGQKVVKVKQQFRNTEVLDALIRLTGVSFNYDVKRWNQWLLTQRKPAAVDIRRD